MKKSKDLLEGRTQEWNTEDYQGRSTKKVNDNEKVTVAAIFLFVIIFAITIIINALANG